MELTTDEKVNGLVDELVKTREELELFKSRVPNMIRESVHLKGEEIYQRWQELDDQRVVAVVARNRGRILSALFLDPFKDLARKAGDYFVPAPQESRSDNPAPATA